MKALTALIKTLAALLTLCPGTLANPESMAQPAPSSTGEHNITAALSQHIGKTIFIKGQLFKIHDGGFGIIPDETPDVRISIDPVKRPKHGELLSEKWTTNNRRRKKLIRLVKGSEPGDTIEVTGKLCHVSSPLLLESVPENISSTQIPDSHFFLSVNDVTILSAGSPPQK